MDVTDHPPRVPHVYLRVEREADNQYRILPSDLETIGAQLRGRPRFSVFNSILLPAIVTFTTIALTSLFQYISWQNSINLQSVSDQAVAATKTYDKAASESEKRFYATLLFQAAVKSIANKKAGSDTQLSQYDAELQKQRFSDFYEQLASWNQNYSQLLPDIGYDIDRPVFRAEWTEEGNQVKSDVLKKIRCDVKSLAEELRANQLNPDILTYQFAAINKCFAEHLRKFGELKDQALANKDRVITDE
jgi:hypothetical protein